MTARTRPRPTPRTTACGVDARLPWWALALPALAFTVLLLLLVGGTGAEAADPARPVAHMLQMLQESWLP